MDNVLHKRAKGNIGEDIACKYILARGFNVIDRNYLKKWGELDIVAEKDNVLHIFEVKSITFWNNMAGSDVHRPEDNVDGWKVKHLRRIIETYIAEKGRQDDIFSFHVLCVYMDMIKHRARIKWLKDVII